MNYTPYPQQQYPNNQSFGYNKNQWNVQSIPQVRPVSSIEEVRAYPIEFDGSVFYFPDVANKKIYTKNINIDGTVTINLYELKELAADQSINSSYVTRQEFNEVITQLKDLYDNLIKDKEQEMMQVAAQPPSFKF